MAEAQSSREKSSASDAPDKGLPPISPDLVEQEFPDDPDNIVPTRGYQMLPMVGLGGSAGSISALQKFFAAMPSDSGMVFVVILHLSPEHESTLPELLSRSTSMRVTHAQDGDQVEANCVYVIPPGSFLASVDGRLSLTKIEPERGRRCSSICSFALSPTPTVRTRRRLSCPAPIAMAQLGSSESRNGAA